VTAPRLRAPSDLGVDLDALRAELGVPGPFPPEVLAAAERAAASPRLPSYDATGLELVTVDPPGSRDLDQAVHLAARGDGYRVSYAIADVAAFVRPGDPIDAEARRRGQTLYAPDRRVPLHPPSLSEGAASLLPGQVTPALLWSIDLDAAGAITGVDVRRALVRSRAQLDYAGLQAALGSGTAPEGVRLLGEVGRLRREQARLRDSLELDLPEQEVERDASGRWSLRLRAPLPVEQWNAEISLLTGMSAAQLMLDGGVGLLRTLPPAPQSAVAALQRAAGPLGIAWPDGASPGDVLAGLPDKDPRAAAFRELSTTLLRGAGYTAFADGALPDQVLHAAIAAPYAHVTAPLRRLADRYANEVVLALCDGRAVPGEMLAVLPELPPVMAASDRLASALERAVVDTVEAVLLADRVGEVFDAAVVDADDDSGTVVLDDPPVRARCEGSGLPLGERLRVRLITAEVASRTVLVRPA